MKGGRRRDEGKSEGKSEEGEEEMREVGGKGWMEAGGGVSHGTSTKAVLGSR